MAIEFDIVLVGGGIAGVTCVESLLLIKPNISICLISATPCVKSTTNVVSLGHIMEKFDVIEQDKSEFQHRFPTVNFVHGEVMNCDIAEKEVFYRNFCKDAELKVESVQYKKLCLCTGGQPNVVLPKFDSGLLITELLLHF